MTQAAKILVTLATIRASPTVYFFPLQLKAKKVYLLWVAFDMFSEFLHVLYVFVFLYYPVFSEFYILLWFYQMI